MRRRSTFIPSPDVDFDPTELKISDRRLSFAGLKAARDEKLTFSLDDLPQEVSQVLKTSHELHIRWTSEEPYEKSGPYLSALTPGLHIHYTPLTTDQNDEGLCDLLKTIFSPSLRCSAPNESFSRTRLTSERFASAASLQYYSLLPSLQKTVAWIQRNVCPSTDVVCKHDVALLNIASYLDIDYDALSHTLTLTAFWSKPPAVLMDPIGEWTTYDHWNLAIDASPVDRNELGILHSLLAVEPSDLQMEGFLTVIGEDDTPKPTMFTFPSRHRTLTPEQSKAQQYVISFDEPPGLHPTLRITFPHTSTRSKNSLQPPSNKPADSTCALHTYLTLPSLLFPDEYAFPTTTPDLLFTAAHHIRSLRSLSGERDLEIPDYAVSKWGAAMLLELETPSKLGNTTIDKASSSESEPESWDITIPLHLRYLPPTPGGYQTVQIPNPIVFWACTAEQGTKFAVNPFDRVNLGYDGLFGPRTAFYHLEPRTQHDSGRGHEVRLVQEVKVPVLDSGIMSYGVTEALTALLVLGGFLYVSWKVVGQILAGTKDGASTKEEHRKKIQ